jgi:transposase
LIWALSVTPASVQDRDGALPLLERLWVECPRLKTIVADGAYQGGFEDYVAVQSEGIWQVHIVKKLADQQGFVVLPTRWLVERTFAWLGHNRRLRADYEHLVSSEEALIRWAMTRLMLRRLSKT